MDTKPRWVPEDSRRKFTFSEGDWAQILATLPELTDEQHKWLWASLEEVAAMYLHWKGTECLSKVKQWNSLRTLHTQAKALHKTLAGVDSETVGNLQIAHRMDTDESGQLFTARDELDMLGLLRDFSLLSRAAEKASKPSFSPAKYSGKSIKSADLTWLAGELIQIWKEITGKRFTHSPYMGKNPDFTGTGSVLKYTAVPQSEGGKFCLAVIHAIDRDVKDETINTVIRSAMGGTKVKNQVPSK
jgi:hypothetical protein